MRLLTCILLFLSLSLTAQEKIKIYQVKASDPDTGQTLTYWIKASNAPEYVGIDSRTGVIYLDSRIFDTFETSRTVSLVVGVIDDGVMYRADGTTYTTYKKRAEKTYSFKVTKNKPVRLYRT